MYLMALPLLSFTNSSSRFFALAAVQESSSFGQSGRNFTWVGNSSYSMQQFHQYLQGSKKTQEEYWPRDDETVVVEKEASTKSQADNNYAWAASQTNPWLSTCDLTGPAPADLQGSCTPPEPASRNCPVACASEHSFLRLIDKFQLAERLRKKTPRTKRKRKRKRTAVDDGDDDDDRESTAAGHSKRDAGRNGTPAKRTVPEQCLFYLEKSHKSDICRDNFGRDSPLSFLTPRENRYWFMAGLRLRHCCEHTVVNALTPGEGGQLEDVLNGGPKCMEALDNLLKVDDFAARLHCEFEDVLGRYDCAQSYSVIYNCTHCKEAYRKWMCSSLVPYFAHGEPLDLKYTMENGTWTRLHPCRTFCQSVEQRCPYLLPGDRAPAYPTQYAGEPTFLCRGSPEMMTS